MSTEAGKTIVIRKPGLAPFLLWTLLGFFLTSLAVSLWQQNLVSAFIQNGWAQKLGIPVENARWFFVPVCVFDTACANAFTARLPYREWTLYIPVTIWTVIGMFIFRSKRVPATSLRYRQHFSTEKEVAPLVETRKLKDLMEGKPPKKAQEKLTGYLGVWLGTSPKDEKEKILALKKKLFLRVPERVERVHSIVYAGTGGGKTVGVFRPRIALDAIEGNLAIIFDTKYPTPDDSYIDVRDWFRYRGWRVYIIDPFGMEQNSEEAIQIPVLAKINDFPSALDVARLVYPPGIEDGDQARVFIANARSLLAGILYGLSLDPRERFSFSRVREIANFSIDELHAWFRSHPESMREIQSTLNADKYVLSGAQNKLVGDLEIFASPAADWLFTPGPKAKTTSEIVKAPGMIHLVFPERQVRGSSGRAILRFFKRYFDQSILEEVERLGGPLPVHVNYYYDELALFHYIPDLDNDLATFRSRNISVHMATQSRAQLESIYKDKWAATENNNIGIFYLVPGSYTYPEAIYWSRTLGTYSEEGYSSSESKTVFYKGLNISYNEKERPLITADEMTTMGIGEMIALVRGFNPILIKTYPLNSPESPLNPFWEEVRKHQKIKLKERLAQAFSEAETTSATKKYQTPPSDIKDIYSAFEEFLKDLAEQHGSLLSLPQETRWGLACRGPKDVLRQLKVDEKMLEAWLEHKFFMMDRDEIFLTQESAFGGKKLMSILNQNRRDIFSNFASLREQ